MTEMPENSPLTVFVVDDEEVITLTLAAILKNSGFHLSTFSSAEDALEAAKTEAPEILITDVNMPGMNGIDFAIQVKSRYPNCKILLFTGCLNTVDLLEVAREKGHEFNIITKPIHPKDLLAAIKRF
jgi:DNA-binding NtrC family response regulator